MCLYRDMKAKFRSRLSFVTGKLLIFVFNFHVSILDLGMNQIMFFYRQEEKSKDFYLWNSNDFKLRSKNLKKFYLENYSASFCDIFDKFVSLKRRKMTIVCIMLEVGYAVFQISCFWSDVIYQKIRMQCMYMSEVKSLIWQSWYRWSLVFLAQNLLKCQGDIQT